MHFQKRDSGNSIWASLTASYSFERAGPRDRLLARLRQLDNVFIDDAVSKPLPRLCMSASICGQRLCVFNSLKADSICCAPHAVYDDLIHAAAQGSSTPLSIAPALRRSRRDAPSNS